ncbi:glycosyltransferase family 4 protein [Xanthobacter sp. AM11]|uniref:glycosyltransferase family 4 protein n=1 Tax=Xanthobacter sp. AM11 TaxID=3380643 RepID=UPI0039BF701C
MSRPLRVAFVHPGDIGTPSGGYAYDRRMIAELSAAGLEIAALRLDGGFPVPTPAQVAAALETLAATAPGTVLLADGLALGALPAAGLAGIGRPLVALCHHPLALETGLDPQLAQQLWESERAALSVCDAIIAISPETWRMLRERYDVPAHRMTLAVPGTEPAARVPADAEPPRLVAVGSLTPRKGYDVLLDALALLDDLAFSLAIVGTPDLDPATAARIARRVAAWPRDNIRLLGRLDAAALERAYAQADIMVHPALYEGYGMVLAEAIRRGLPVVCTTGGAAGETVPDGAGLKVPPGDAPALAAALRRLITDRELRRSLADGAFAAGQALPSWADTAATIRRVLERVAA